MPPASINRPKQVLPAPETVFVSVDPKVSWLDEIPQGWMTITDLKTITEVLNGEAATFKGKPRPYTQTFALAFETFRSHYLQPGATVPVLAMSQTGEQAIVVIGLGGSKAAGAYINLDTTDGSQNVSYSITKHEVRERKT